MNEETKISLGNFVWDDLIPPTEVPNNKKTNPAIDTTIEEQSDIRQYFTSQARRSKTISSSISDSKLVDTTSGQNHYTMPSYFAEVRNFYEKTAEQLEQDSFDSYVKEKVNQEEPKKKVVPKINKTEETFINFNELANELAVNDLLIKYGEYDEVEMIGEWVELTNKYTKIILKHERNTE